ncbi:ABC transporter ATP-binding protein [Georgenia satyanarayanai]|uniref:ABC transporter ATP-binding protein n=1 Tax=Georgenia satyanarayanai TaxID=860221 RepID=UPI001265A9ED|nr:ATP-binding cassette domain-containing protein [Georgenia satyanarayanai]
MSDDLPAIEVTGLRKSFGPTRVLDGISFSVARGEVFALLGPNGAGKTTTVNVLSTLVRPDAGRVVVGGHDVVRHPRAVHRTISLTGQFAAVDELLTGRENLRMMGRLGHLDRADLSPRVNGLLARFGLTDAADRRVSTYSGGMRRRLDIAISLLPRPAVLVLDEPTTGLDPRSRQAVWRLVGELSAEGVTVVLTTQYLEEADALADRVAVLHGGRVVGAGSPAELKRLVGEDVVEIHYADGRLASVPTTGSLADVRRILDGVAGEGHAVERLAMREPSLDDVFLRLTDTPAEVHP